MSSLKFFIISVWIEKRFGSYWKEWIENQIEFIYWSSICWDNWRAIEKQHQILWRRFIGLVGNRTIKWKGFILQVLDHLQLRISQEMNHRHDCHVNGANTADHERQKPRRLHRNNSVSKRVDASGDRWSSEEIDGNESSWRRDDIEKRDDDKRKNVFEIVSMGSSYAFNILVAELWLEVVVRRWIFGVCESLKKINQWKFQRSSSTNLVFKPVETSQQRHRQHFQHQNWGPEDIRPENWVF
jgi:hypothetical protein